MKNITNGLWGIVFIILAILAILHMFDVITLYFFPGWWTLFIIVPCFIGLFRKQDRKGAVIGIIIGLLLLLSARHLLDFSIVWKIVVVIVFLAIGLSLIFNNKNRDQNVGKNSKSISVIFGGEDVSYDGAVEFDGCDCKAIFGGIDLDLTGAQIKQNTYINATAIFGGVDIHVPDNVKIEINSTGIFGGVENKNSKNVDGEFIIYINATAIFGGVDIK